MEQVFGVLLLLVDLGDPVVLSEDQGWIVGLRENCRGTQTLISNFTTFEVTNFGDLVHEFTIVVEIVFN